MAFDFSGMNDLTVRILLICALLFSGEPSGIAKVARPAYYAGGVAGIEDLLLPSNSRIFRSGGGGLYLHNTGWGRLPDEEKKGILTVFQNHPVAVELGFGSGPSWGKLYEDHYLAYGVKPTFVCCDPWNSGKPVTPELWRAYADAVREHGIPPSTPILPIFGYQNYPEYVRTLSQNKVSSSKVFQAIIEQSGGIVLDTPPKYTMQFREQAYRDWVVDAIQWTKQRGLQTIVLISPGNFAYAFYSGVQWPGDTAKYLRYLYTHRAIPAVFVCMNYSDHTPPKYPNRVGNEKIDYTALGECLLIKQQIMPNLP
jgi:hypothetical protein